jgi:hypothetical protein
VTVVAVDTVVTVVAVVTVGSGNHADSADSRSFGRFATSLWDFWKTSRQRVAWIYAKSCVRVCRKNPRPECPWVSCGLSMWNCRLCTALESLLPPDHPKPQSFAMRWSKWLKIARVQNFCIWMRANRRPFLCTFLGSLIPDSSQTWNSHSQTKRDYFSLQKTEHHLFSTRIWTESKTNKRNSSIFCILLKISSLNLVRK